MIHEISLKLQSVCDNFIAQLQLTKSASCDIFTIERLLKSD